MDCELLAPAGNFETALAAFEAGADAVYCGLTEFSARAFADNFGIEDLKKLLQYTRSSDGAKKVYVTFNTIVDEGELDAAVTQLAQLDAARPDGIIVQDLGIARLCRRYFPALALHASTQLVAHNLEGVLALKDLGFVRVVLARELSLEEIASIAKRCGELELEVFVHGALCYSLSGLCLFGAMENGRSGNRGKCPYCCREARAVDGSRTSRYPFSMKDLRLGEDVRKLADLGVASLKIEGRMKSALYVASVTRYYRDILDGAARRITPSDLETVFSRRTTKLYLDGRAPIPKTAVLANGSPIDSESLGHLGAEIGVVKKVTRDREDRAWLRFHTARGLEKHDGLQFEAMTAEGRHLGMGIVEMRQAISRRPVFEVNAGMDVEVLVNEEVAAALKPGMKIYCSMSNAVKRRFPTPSFRPSDYSGSRKLEVEVTLAPQSAVARCGEAKVAVACELMRAKNPEKTFAAVEKAFSKLGGSDYALARLTVNDPERLFAPMSVLNDLRRDLVEQLDAARARQLGAKIEQALAGEAPAPSLSGNAAAASRSCRRVKVRAGQAVPPGDWDEVIVAINAATKDVGAAGLREVRLALPVYTAETEFNRLRTAVKRFLRAGYARWEASDLATLRMLKQLGVTDLTADWTLYAFNSRSLAVLAESGVKRWVASPENSRENLRYLAKSGYDIEFLQQQSTPLFISLTEPAARPPELAVYLRDGLWVTTKPMPRMFEPPKGVALRTDLSWDPE